MGVGQPVHDRLEQFQHLLAPAGGPTLSRSASNGLPFQILHDNEQGPVALFKVIDLDDVRMIQSGHDPGLLTKIPDEIGIHGHIMFHHFNGHRHFRGPGGVLYRQC